MKKIYSFSILFGLFFIALNAQNLRAATYYVSQSGAGNSSGSSYANRMSVSNFENGNLGSLTGHTVYLCGNITEKITMPGGGSAGNYLTVRGDYKDHTLNLNPGGDMGIETNGKDYIIFQSLVITNARYGLNVADGSDYITIKKCTIHDSSAFYGERGIFLGTSNNIIIGGAYGDGNTIYNIGGDDTADADISVSLHCIGPTTISYNRLYGNGTSTGGDGIVAVNTSNLLVEYNTIYGHFREDGIDFKGVNSGTVRYNNIYSNGNPAKVGSGVKIHRSSKNINIYGNNIHQNTEAGILVMDNQDGSGLTDNIRIWTNLIWGNASAGVTVIKGDGEGVGNVYIYYNVLAENNTLNNSSNGGLSIKTSGASKHVKNNIFYKNSTTSRRQAYYSVAPGSLDYNYYYWPGHTSYVYYSGANRTISELQSSYYKETNGDEVDPKMADPDNNDYTLSSTSPCIDKGTNLGVSFDDALDPYNTNFSTTPPILVPKSRNDYGWHLGAYVFRGDSAPTVSAPKQLKILQFVQ